MIAAAFARRFCGNLGSTSSRSLTINVVAALSSCSGSFVPLCHYSLVAAAGQEDDGRDVFLTFRDWFRSGKIDIFDQVFKVLKERDEDKESGLSKLRLPITTGFVLQVLSYGNARYDVLSCLKFFDWAGRQPGFHHTRVTFHAVFKILSRAKLMPLMVEILDNYVKHRFIQRLYQFQNILVMGYALAGQIPVALQVFGEMRFHGLNLDGYVYNILLNVLVEEEFYEAADAISKLIIVDKLDDEVTNSIFVKLLCKQKMFDEAEACLRKNGSEKMDRGLSVLVNALCQNNEVEKAGKLVEEFQSLGKGPMKITYSVWIQNLVRNSKLNDSVQFLEASRQEGFIPDTGLCNLLLLALLKANKIKHVCLLLLEMQENGVFPDHVTLSASLCFLCKVGMTDVALNLNEAKSEFGMSPNGLAYSHLISSLTAEGRTNEALQMLESSFKQGCIPGRRAFVNLAIALCREKKLDKMKELLLLACKERHLMTDTGYAKFISEFCKTRRAEDGYLIFLELNRMNMVAGQATYDKLIRSMKISNRGDIAARLLVEMQEKGYTPSRSVFISVIECLLKMENPEAQFLKVLEVQLFCHGRSRKVYNYFIEGAGHAKKPELARKVYELMQENGIEPTSSSDLLLLRSYLKNNRLSEAMEFFELLRSKKKIGRKLCNTIVVGLCQINRLDLALSFTTTMKQMGIFQSGLCFEILIQKLCRNHNFDQVAQLIHDLSNGGRRITSYTGNVLLFTSMTSEKLYESWTRFLLRHREVHPLLTYLHDVIRVFSSRSLFIENIERVESMIEKCFPINIITYNMLIKRLSLDDMEVACKILNRLIEKGFKPNKWTLTTITRGFLNQGMTYQALEWLEDMENRGFNVSHTSFVFRSVS